MFVAFADILKIGICHLFSIPDKHSFLKTNFVF